MTVAQDGSLNMRLRLPASLAKDEANICALKASALPMATERGGAAQQQARAYHDRGWQDDEQSAQSASATFIFPSHRVKRILRAKFHPGDSR
jgi:hypothetical protein